MRKTRLALAAAAAGLLTAFTATSAMAVDYSEPVAVVTGGDAADGVVAPGEEFTLSGNFGGTECDPWVGEFEGDTVEGSGTTWSVTFTAPTAPGTYYVTLTCTYDDAASAQASGVKAVLPFEATTSLPPIAIVVEGDGAGSGSGSGSGSDSGALPDTGGSNLLLIAGGAALVVAGAGVLAARRRNS